MKRVFILLVVSLSVIGIKMYASSDKLVFQESKGENASVRGVDPYLCMYSADKNDCITGHDNYCICSPE